MSVKRAGAGGVTRRLMAVGCILALAGCAGGSANAPPAGADRASLATVVVYRTNTQFDSMNIAPPFVYIDDKSLGTIRVGTQLGADVPAGTYRVSVRRSIAFMPATEIGAVSVTAEAGKTYYVRFSLEAAGVAVTPTGAYLPSTGSLSLVDEATARRGQ
jgi:hypothetical protein